MKNGLFVVLEGVEGAGKSTQASLLSDWFRRAGVPFTLGREPGGTPVGEAIRRVVLDRDGLTMPPETELFLILGARAAFVQEVVRPALDEGKLFLADRFDLSTFAYQGFGRGLDLLEVQRANEVATRGLKPDLYLVLDLPVELGLSRKQGGGEGDRIEKEGAGFLTRVREGYTALAMDTAGARLVSAEGTADQVQMRLRQVLIQTFPETFRDAEV